MYKLLRFVLCVLLLAGATNTMMAQSTLYTSCNTSLFWTFDGCTVGDSLPHVGWSTSAIQAVVADDPVNSGHNVLKCTPHNYDAAPLFKFCLPTGKTLSDYTALKFKGYFYSGDVSYKHIGVEVYKTQPTSGFFYYSMCKTHMIGDTTRSSSGSTAWEYINIGLKDTNATSMYTQTDTMYLVFGINCSGTGSIGGSGSQTIWYADSIQLVPVSALPVELTSFTAATAAKSVNLQWATATEVNNYGFDVERRAVGSSSWSRIAFVAGNGTSNVAHSYNYSDNAVVAGSYAYRLKQIDNDGTFKYSQESEVTLVPQAAALGQNYPNPFNPTTTIEFSLPSQSNVRLVVVNILGQEVKELTCGSFAAGSHKVVFDATKMASGMYFYRLETNGFSDVKKLVLLK
jgi:hypothetical protein